MFATNIFVGILVKFPLYHNMCGSLNVVGRWVVEGYGRLDNSLIMTFRSVLVFAVIMFDSNEVHVFGVLRIFGLSHEILRTVGTRVRVGCLR